MLLLFLFFASGCAALIYEIVWFQLLELVIGSSGVSLGVLLGTYMGGMCLGSLALPRMVSARRNPLRVYALLELGIGICGIAVLFGMPSAGQWYAASVARGLPGILLRAALSAVCLLPPTMLMGATLPAAARSIGTSPEGVSRMGYLYGANIAGAVFGSLLAGFYLLRVHDMAVATFVAAAVNGAVATAALLSTARAGPCAAEPPPASPAAAPRAVYVAIALSGLSALGAEVVWTRLLSLMLGATVYTFSIILAVFLLGLGIGSGAGSFLARRLDPRIAFGGCQLLLAAGVAWAAYMLADSLPYWRAAVAQVPSLWFVFRTDLLRCLAAILPAAFLWGASFPLALAAAARKQDAARLVGGIYAANTVGAIAGAIGFSMAFIPWLGTHDAQRLLIVISLAAALLLLVPLARSLKPAAAAALIAATITSAGLAWMLPRVPWQVTAFGRRLTTNTGRWNLLYMGEGMNASIAITEFEDRKRFFHVSGKIEASSEPHDMRLERMLGHLPALFHPHPRSVLVVGCGAGVTAGSFVPHPEIQRILICEIEPLIPPVVARYFGPENHGVVRNPRTRLVYDDARHYVFTSEERFDIITSDPIHPWVKGAATLYSKDYFEMCKRRLNPGGLITQWVPLYESNPETVRSEIATFFEVFPNGTIWSNDIDGEGYDVVLLGGERNMRVDLDAMERRLAAQPAVADSLREVGFGSAVDLLGTYAAHASDLRRWLAGAQINRDRNLRLQYLAGMGLNTEQSNAILTEILNRRRFPLELFVASDPRRQALRRALGLW